MSTIRNKRTAAQVLAEEAFAASKKKDQQAIREKEKAQAKRVQQAAELKAQRLAKQAAEKATPVAVPAKKAKSKAANDLPQFHRF